MRVKATFPRLSHAMAFLDGMAERHEALLASRPPPQWEGNPATRRTLVYPDLPVDFVRDSMTPLAEQLGGIVEEIPDVVGELAARLAAEAEAAGVDDDALAESVIDHFTALAADVNNGGLAGRIETLLEEADFDEVRIRMELGLPLAGEDRKEVRDGEG